MIYFPHNPLKRAAAAVAGVRQSPKRDVIWNRPLFKAPALPIPDVTIDPLPFMAGRVTQRPARS